MKCTGIKIIVERQDGEITTWHDTFNSSPERHIKQVLEFKQWNNGRVIEAYLEFDHNGSYLKVWLDVDRNNLSAYLKTP